MRDVTIVVGTIGQSIMRSEDNGQTWARSAAASPWKRYTQVAGKRRFFEFKVQRRWRIGVGVETLNVEL